MLEIWIRVSQTTYLTVIRIAPQNPWSQSDILTKQFEVKVFRLLLVRLYKKNWYRNKLDHKWMNEKKSRKNGVWHLHKLKKCPRTRSRSWSCSGINCFIHASSCLRNDNSNDSEDDNVIITIIMIMIMMAMAIMV